MEEEKKLVGEEVSFDDVPDFGNLPVEEDEEQQPVAPAQTQAPQEQPKDGKKKKIKGKASTILSGVFVSIGLTGIGLAYLINLNNFIAEMMDGKSGADAAAAVFGLIIVIALIVMVILGLVGLPFILSIPSLVCSAKNIKKAETKPLRIIGIVFTVLSVLIMVLAVLRLVLLFANVM